MHQGPSTTSSREEAEYLQDLTARQLRARQLFNCYLQEEEEDDLLEEATDDYCAYYEESAR